MLSKLSFWFAKKWASKAASNIMLAILASVLVSGVWYVQGLRIKVAKCKATQVQAERYDQLADRLAQELNKDRDAVIKILESGDNPCLDLRVDELLNP